MPDLLPGNATPLERGLSLSTDVHESLSPTAEAIRGLKLVAPPNSFLPFIAYEYGLGPITPYFADQREMLAEGIAWSRVRGTYAALARALSWITYAAGVEPFPVRRRRWNLFMLGLASLPAADAPDLAKIDDLANLSAPLRSKFWRGYRDYDVRAVDYGYSRWSAVRWSDYSGRRLAPTGAKWSFGRAYDVVHTPTQSELTALGVWISTGGSSLTWGAFAWNDDPSATWASNPADLRVGLMVNATLDRPVWVCFRDAANAVIGYRRARVVRGVSVASNGPYTVNTVSYVEETQFPRNIYIEALTDFGDGYGATATSWSLLFDATPLESAKPGLLWAPPGALSAGTEIITTTQTIKFRQTVRERFRVLLNF